MTDIQISPNETQVQEYTLRASEVTARYKTIVGVMEKTFKIGVHYGDPYEGAGKKVLLKPGADVMCVLFQFMPDYAITMRAEGEHREYEIITVLKHVPTNKIISTGVGVCSTKESKYRYRGNELVSTGKAVPREYWDIRKEDAKEAQRLIGGPGFKASKIDDVWTICKMGEKAENPDIADVYNTVLKMAKKRSYVDAIITATASSNLFTQDVDEPDNEFIYGADSFDTDETTQEWEEVQGLCQEILSEKEAQKIKKYLDENPDKLTSVLVNLRNRKSVTLFLNDLSTQGFLTAEEFTFYSDALNAAKSNEAYTGLLVELGKHKIKREKEQDEDKPF